MTDARPPVDPFLPRQAQEALHFWHQRAGAKLGETRPGEALRRTWKTWKVQREKPELQRRTAPSVALDGLGREIISRRLGAGVTGLILIDGVDAILVERLIDEDAQLWLQAGFRLIEPDGRHVLKGVLDWMADKRRQGTCLVMQFGKSGIAPFLRTCQPPFDATICMAGEQYRFDLHRVMALKTAIEKAGEVAIESWKSHAADLALITRAAGSIDKAGSRRLLNAATARIDARAGLFPSGLSFPAAGSPDHHMLDFALRCDAALPLVT